MNASCQTAAGVGWLGGQARPGQAKPREREREWRNIKYKSGNPFLSFSASLWSHRSIFYERPPLKWDQTVRVVRLDRCLLWPAVAPQRSYQLWKCERERERNKRQSNAVKTHQETTPERERDRIRRRKKKENKRTITTKQTGWTGPFLFSQHPPVCIARSRTSAYNIPGLCEIFKKKTISFAHLFLAPFCIHELFRFRWKRSQKKVGIQNLRCG